MPQASLILLVLAIGMTMMGLTASLREIVKELPVFKRERAVGLSTSAYVLSKMSVLGLIVVYQAVAYMLISTANQDGPRDAVVLGWPLGRADRRRHRRSGWRRSRSGCSARRSSTRSRPRSRCCRSC